MICGIGYSDIKTTNKDNVHFKSYKIWSSILRRCYSKSDSSYSRYGAKGVTVHPSWLYYSNFKDWFDKNYVEGYHLDKDLLQVGNKMYSVETCCFIAPEHNSSLASINKDYSFMKGDKHFKSKSKESYEFNKTNRSDFKRTCKRQGWAFDDFEEIPTGEKDKFSVKSFYYIFKKRE
ncbi:MAG: hypothetical protein ACRCUS_08195 [Anaerovoracaceae bacterium]